MCCGTKRRLIAFTRPVVVDHLRSSRRQRNRRTTDVRTAKQKTSGKTIASIITGRRHLRRVHCNYYRAHVYRTLSIRSLPTRPN